jgi:hypothetical protein
MVFCSISIRMCKAFFTGLSHSATSSLTGVSPDRHRRSAAKVWTRLRHLLTSGRTSITSMAAASAHRHPSPKCEMPFGGSRFSSASATLRFSRHKSARRQATSARFTTFLARIQKLYDVSFFAAAGVDCASDVVCAITPRA